MHPWHRGGLTEWEGLDEEQGAVFVPDLVALVEVLILEDDEGAIGTIGAPLLLVVDDADVLRGDCEADLVLDFADGGADDRFSVFDGPAGQDPQGARPFGVLDENDSAINREDGDLDGAIFGMIAPTVTFLAHGALLEFPRAMRTSTYYYTPNIH